MSILQSGKAKSGNYWVYKIIQTALDLKGVDKKSFIKHHPILREAQSWQLSHRDQAGIDVLSIEPTGLSFRIGDRFRDEIQDIDSYIAKCSHVWTHSPFQEEWMDVYKRFDKIVYVIRDPRDVAISMARFSFTPYMLAKKVHRETDENAYLNHRLYGSVLSWVHHVAGHLLKVDELAIHCVFYERLKYCLADEVKSLLRYLDLELEDAKLSILQEEVDFTKMRAENPEHVRKGRAYEWVERLSQAQKDRVLRITGPMLQLLHYPTDISESDLPLPRMPVTMTDDEIRSIVARSRGSFADKLAYGFSFARSGRPLGEKWQKGLDFIFGRDAQ